MEPVVLQPLGLLRTPHTEPDRTPIQPGVPKADQPESAWGGWTEALEPGTARRIGTRQG